MYYILVATEFRSRDYLFWRLHNCAICHTQVIVGVCRNRSVVTTSRDQLSDNEDEILLFFRHCLELSHVDISVLI